MRYPKVLLKDISTSIVMSILSFFVVSGVIYAATTIGSNITTGGNIAVAPAFGIDTSSAGTLNIGTTTATTINIGGTQATIKSLGNFQIPANYSIDTAAAGALNIGTTTATSITIGKATVPATLSGGASTTMVTASASVWVGGNATTSSTGTFLTNGSVGVGTSTPYEISSSHATATTTLSLHAAGANKGGCLELTGPANAQYRIYIGGNGALVTEAGRCK